MGPDPQREHGTALESEQAAPDGHGGSLALNQETQFFSAKAPLRGAKTPPLMKGSSRATASSQEAHSDKPPEWRGSGVQGGHKRGSGYERDPSGC
jgi:hypothetical protein